MRTVVIAAVILDNNFAVLIVRSCWRDQLPATAILRQVISEKHTVHTNTHTHTQLAYYPYKDGLIT